MQLEDVTFKNHSGFNLTMILPDGYQNAFPNGTITSFTDTGKYHVKDGSDSVYSFTYEINEYIASVNLTNISVGGYVAFENYAGFEITVISASSEENIPNGSTRNFFIPGSYTVKRTDSDKTIYIFNYHKGTAAVRLNGLAK
ncbi:hypothetical protein F5148DRAFT_1152187 [Russula earlei]|uniref:Uncharacterized protein n=1 Tax=Russula earlei TaxID=71964 RepID=A0ACC0TX93_9AGAM|nr:hypothetical protein F5148DRAFT_1152187 [Russula earlei]